MRYLLFSVLSIMLAGCHAHEGSTVTAPPDGTELPILQQITGQHSHETRAMNLVIREPSTLAQVPLADVPVNFAKEMVLIVTLGRMTTDRNSVSIDRVWREGSRLRVATTVHAIQERAAPAITSPYAIAVIPRCDLNVVGFVSEPPPRERSWEQSELPSSWGGPKNR